MTQRVMEELNAMLGYSSTMPRCSCYTLRYRLLFFVWFWAMMQAAYEYRCKILGTPLPVTAPRFGDRVLIQKTLPHSSFQSNAEEGRFLTWDTTTLQGALVATVRNGTLAVVPSSAPMPWPKAVNERNQNWTLIQPPNSRERVWVGEE